MNEIKKRLARTTSGKHPDSADGWCLVGHVSADGEWMIYKKDQGTGRETFWETFKILSAKPRRGQANYWIVRHKAETNFVAFAYDFQKIYHGRPELAAKLQTWCKEWAK